MTLRRPRKERARSRLPATHQCHADAAWHPPSRERNIDTQAMLEDEDIRWLHRLSGYPEERILAAVERVEAWRIPDLSTKLGSESGADGYLAATMLCQALDWLHEADVDEDRLLAKLRRPEVWSTWTEIRVAGLAAHLLERVRKVELDVRVGESGRNSDFRFRLGDDTELHRLEVKALGLSAADRQFCRRWAPVLRAVRPAQGICTMHANIRSSPRVFTRAERRFMCREAVRSAKRTPAPHDAVSATVVVAQGTRKQYIRRLTAAIAENLSQLPNTDVGWMAFHWSNGAPVSLVAEAVPQLDLPRHIAGVMLVGSVMMLGHTHHLLMAGFRNTGGQVVFQSRIDGFDPSPIIERCENSAGVRPTIIRVPDGRGFKELIVRDGSEAFWPFNILLAPDPLSVQQRPDARE